MSLLVIYIFESHLFNALALLLVWLFLGGLSLEFFICTEY